jgi:hypothetical protein
MQFPPVFQLLKKFTPGLENRSVAVTREEMDAVAKYLGVTLSAGDHEEAYLQLQNELSDQNRFLTAKLSCDDIIHCELFRRSQFIQDIVVNNRRNAKSK